jgi:hypothetical protein
MAVDYQLEYRGLLMGANTDYHVTKIDGLEDDSVRVADSAIPRAGGDIPGLHVANSRDVVITVFVKGEKDSQDQRDKVQALVDAFQHSDDQHKFLWQEPGFADRRYVWARAIGRASSRDPRYPFLPGFTLRLKLADPRTYRETQDQDTLIVYSATGGGLDYDIGVGAAGFTKDYTVDPASETVMTNNGNAPAWPLIRFYGPTVGTVTEVTLTNVTTGGELVLGTTILTGQILTADMYSIITVAPSALHVIRLGTTNKYTDWAQPREPFYIAPGDNTLRFEVSAGTSTDATCVITFNDTWL